MEIEAKIRLYEIEGKAAIGPGASLKVAAHWNQDYLVVIDLTGLAVGKVTVSAKELREAVDRCTGWKHS